MAILVFSHRPELTAEAERLLISLGHEIRFATAGSMALRLARQEQLTAAILDEDADAQIGTQLAAISPGALRILLQTSRDARRTCQAFRHGYGAVLLIPEEMSLLPETITRLCRSVRRMPSPEGGSQAGARVIAVYSAAGGSGRSTVAAHLATALASAGTRTLALDLSFHTGSLRHLCEEHGTRSVIDLVPVLDELHETHLRNAVTGLRPNLDLLGAPVGGTVSPLSEQEVRQLLEGCARSYEATVIDLPAVITPDVAAVLRRATDVLYLLNPDPVGGWSLTNALAQWEHWELTRERLHVVLNYRSPTQVLLEPDETGKLFTLNVRDRILFDPAIAFTEVGKVWKRPRSLVGLPADVKRIAGWLQQEGEPHPFARATPGLMRRLGHWVRGGAPHPAVKGAR